MAHHHRRRDLLVLVGLSTALSVGAVHAAGPSATEAERDGVRIVATHPSTGVARILEVEPARRTAAAKVAPDDALAFLTQHGAAFGIRDAASELVPAGVRTDRLGWRHERFEQSWRGVPVYAGELRVHLDDDGRVRSANGTFVPDLDLDTTPRSSARDAEIIARRELHRVDGVDPATVEIETRLVVYHTGLVRSVPGEARLAWHVEVRDGAQVREELLIDATDGRLLDRFTGIHTLDRTVYHGSVGTLVWREGDAVPFSDSDPGTSDEEVNTVIDTSEQVHNLFANLSGGTFLSWDGADATMQSIVQLDDDDFCPANARWNGNNAGFCDGTATDDVTAHEWVHAYTDSTHGLIYAWQSGALNEAYSDIFGEVVDLLNGRGGDTPGGLRTATECSQFGAQPRPELTVASPDALAGGLAAVGASFNPPAPWSVTAEVELASDATGTASDACEPLLGFTPGRIALIDRGDCTFVLKAQHAEAAGAAGMIVSNIPGSNPVGGMAGEGTLSIPSVFVELAEGLALRSALGAGLTVTLAQAGSTDPSVRWLVGEDSSAFGGPIRDMWNPACFGHPGMVEPTGYWCDPGDSGGVHINSGVPNRAFALAVDGGEVDGVPVTGIGLTKAAHIWWRAMSVYQVSSTDFAEHADLVVLSCDDLVGAPLTDLLDGTVASEVVTTADCTQVDAAMDAVRMRVPPGDVCGRVLTANPPVVPGIILFEERFDDEPDDWIRTNEGVFSEYTPRDWRWSSNGGPEGGVGDGAMYAVNSSFIGGCEVGVNDQSGVMRLASPVIEVPAGYLTPVVEVDHLMASEAGFDGGNVKLRVADGDWRLIPADAFRFNPYNGTLRAADDPTFPNTNPLAGETAYTGKDGGIPGSAWGQSQIDLRGLVAPGEPFELRFDFGNDGCGGELGWYLDAVRVRAEENAPRRPARRAAS
jgi:Zn-dependent metalloprotease